MCGAVLFGCGSAALGRISFDKAPRPSPTSNPPPRAADRHVPFGLQSDASAREDVKDFMHAAVGPKASDEALIERGKRIRDAVPTER